MPLYAPVKEGGDSYPVPPAEPILGCLVAMEYVGVHRSVSKKYGTKDNDTLLLTYELEERDPRGKPFTVAERLTHSLSERATLRKRVGTMAPGTSDEDLRTFDLDSLIGSVVLVTVRHYKDRKGETRAAVANVGNVPRGLLASLGEEGFVTEGDYSEPTGLAKYLRGQGSNPCQSLVDYDPEKYAAPRPAHEKRQQDERSSDSDNTDDIPY